MANTPIRYVRVNSELWDAAKKRAARDGREVSELIRQWLAEYVDGKLPTSGVDPQVPRRIRAVMDELYLIINLLAQ